MNNLIYAFLIFAILIGGFILQVEVSSVDTSLWNFTGSVIAGAFIDWSGAIFIVVGCSILFLVGKDKNA